MSGEERSSPYKYILKKSIRQTSDQNKVKYSVTPVLVVTHRNGGVTTEYSMTA